MKFRSWMLCAVAALPLLAACGGGDDQSGSLTEFAVHPAEFGLKSAGPTCAPAPNVVQVFVTGGAAPYTIMNPYPNYLSVSQPEVSKDGSFQVSFLGGCTQEQGIGLVVKDQLGRIQNVTLSYVPS